MKPRVPNWKEVTSVPPNEWNRVFLGDVFAHRQERGQINLPLLSVTAKNGVVRQDTLNRRDTSNDDKSRYFRICPGDIVYNTMRMWQGVSALTNDEGIVSPAYTICTPKDGILSKYAKYLFKFQPLINVFRGYSQGLVNDTLNLKFESFSQIEIILPPIQEQKKIVAILCSVDDAIQATQAVIDQTRRVKQGLLQQLLTRGIGHTRFKQTEIGEIPQSWELTTLGKITNKNSLQTGPFGSQLHASEYIESGIPVVMPKDLFNGRILDDNIACVPEDVADRLMKHRLQAGDILFARRGDIGRCSLVRDSEVGWICGTGCLRARVNDKISPEFLIQFLQWPKTVKWLNENAVGQTMLNLNTQILANLPILVPPKHEQINITNIFESINDELDKLISEKSTLLSIKNGLMQDLLTGRMHVGDST